MAEAEDVITDVARHAVDFAQALWLRHHPALPRAAGVLPDEVARRTELLILAVFGVAYPFRVAQPPAPLPLLARAFRRREPPRQRAALPATDGASIWLPADWGVADPATAIERFRLVALQQAMRARRGSATWAQTLDTPLAQDLFLLIEADAADAALSLELPGIVGGLNRLRRAALAARPGLDDASAPCRPLERFVRSLLERPLERALRAPLPPEESAASARQLSARLSCEGAADPRRGIDALFRDTWTGEFRTASTVEMKTLQDDAADAEGASRARSARMTRRPEVRAASDDEDDAGQGAWMIQSAPPQEHVEDPFGMQRPTDRDAQQAAAELADALSGLPQARLVSTPGRPKEYLLSEDPLDARSVRMVARAEGTASAWTYPEWDYRLHAYGPRGATVRLSTPPAGPQQWVDRTLEEHRSMIEAIRRRFGMLRARRNRLRRQLDGEDVDLDACVDSLGDRRAGLPMSEALYETCRRARRDMATLLLIDVSGSTDGWISAGRRVVDVEREALLLVCFALEALGEPYAVQAFSGHGPGAVTLRTIKRFDEAFGNVVARRIAGLEPEEFTRAGAALRHATATLMREPAAHRLLVLLSDGKPNDVDLYEGRYGVEDTRQAVGQARLQGVWPFCLTVDRRGADYLPAVFGTGHYALLTKPEALPLVLLDWMKRLIVS